MENLPPEVVAQLIRQGGTERRQSMLEKQLDQLQAAKAVDDGNHSTGWGAALGGLGNLFQTVGNGIKENRLRGKEEGLQGDIDRGREAAADAYARGEQTSQSESADAANPSRFQSQIGAMDNQLSGATSPMVGAMGSSSPMSPQQPLAQQPVPQMPPGLNQKYLRGQSQFGAPALASPFDF